MRCLDTKKREDEILDLLVDSYIEESHPISSSYLCRKYNLCYSSATVRNVMESLERQGFLFHVHTSSGRVPTKYAFKHYVGHLNKEELIKESHHHEPFSFEAISDVKELFEAAVEALSNKSGYTSLIGIWGEEERLFFRGMRFMLEQPEFEDIIKLRNLFYALEVKIDQIQDVLFNCIGEDLKIVIGDDIGFDEISDCSLLISGIKERNFSLALALIGPMRMNYVKACESLYSVKCTLGDILRD